MHKKNLTEAIYKKLCEVIPGGVNSPARAAQAMGQLPMVVEAGEKDTLIDVNGNRYIDYCGSWGALIHGHAHPAILEKVAERMVKGTTFGITTAVEEKLARKVVQLIDSIEKVRFVNSGTEATMSAVRVARGFTGRKKIVKFDGNYHGHADFFLIKSGSGLTGLNSTSSSAGIPDEVVQHVVSLPYNDVETARQYLKGHEVAAVIVEPIAGNMGVVPGKPEFLSMLREETEKQGAVLIFDEVITGFRVAMKGAESLYGIRPDLSCLGKIVGGGFPLAAFGGRSQIMDCLAPLGPVYQAGTLSGNPVAVEAGLKALEMLEKPGFYETLESKTHVVTEPVKEWILNHSASASLQQVGSMFTLFFGRSSVHNQEQAVQADLGRFKQFYRYMYANGIYIPPGQFEAWFVSMAHEKSHLEKTRDLVLRFLEEN